MPVPHRCLEEQVLDARRRVLGPEHPATLKAGRRLVVTGGINKFISLLVRLVPRGLVLDIARKAIGGSISASDGGGRVARSSL